jgi:hypothetical protein
MEEMMRISITALALLSLAACDDKGDSNTGNGLIDADGDGFTSDFDCDDDNEAINPAAEELCDEIDNNCNDSIDESPSDGAMFYADGDGDSYGNPDVTVLSCSDSVQGYVSNSEDCNDGTSSVFPGGTELCDGFDNDCNGEIDDGAGDILTFYADTDGDGYGDVDNTIAACAAPSGYVADASDCNDAEASVNPDTLWYPDYDVDGFGRDELAVLSCEQPNGYVINNLDCDDNAGHINPDAEEICDGLDSNCDGKQDADDIDGDLDGQTPCQGDCDDLDSTVLLGGEEICDDGLDNDCDSRLNNNCAEDTSASDMTITGSASYGYLGYGGDIADVDGDGVSDLLIGAYGAGSPSYSGRVYIFLGPLSSGSASTSDADIEIAGTASYDYAGGSVLAGEDINGDGYSDTVVHARDTSYSGMLYVYYGPLTAGTDLDAADAVISGNSSDYLGNYGAFQIADVDGDGNAEVIAGAYYYDHEGSYSTGAIGIWSDPSGEMDYDDADVFFTSDTTYAYVGYDLVADADFDGDGNADMGWAESGEDLAYITYGPLTGDYTATSADITITGQYNDYTGSSITAGDFNGDGYDDMVLGSQYANGYLGMYQIFNGPISSDLSTAKDANTTITGSGSYNYVGYNYDEYDVADIDDDGYEDFAFGVASDSTSGSSYSGAGFIHYGPISGSMTTSTFDRAFYGTSTYQYHGRGLALGDLDDDGAIDMMTGAYGVSSYAGQIYVFFNSTL